MFGYSLSFSVLGARGGGGVARVPVGGWFRLGDKLLLILVGIVGAYATVVLGERFGNRGPLLAGLIISAMAMALMLNADDLVSYTLASFLLGGSWAFTLPYYQSLQAEIDPAGSVVAAGSFASTIGNAAGPGIASTILLFGGYPHILWAAIAMVSVCIVGLLFSQYRVQRNLASV